MPLQKPGGRKRPSHKKAYLASALLIIIVLVGVGYYTYGLLNAPPKPSTPPKPSVVYATINTSMGSFEVELFNSSTPKTVANFVSLAESGFYNNLTWWRVEPGFVIQTGENKSQPEVASIPFEYDPSLHNYEGYLGMASTAPGAGGSSQFYINLANNTSLDGKYAVFGKVISGMNVVQAIGAVPVEAVGGVHEPITPVYVIDIKILNNP